MESEHGADMVVISDGAGFEIPPISAGGDSGGENGPLLLRQQRTGHKLFHLGPGWTRPFREAVAWPLRIAGLKWDE